VILPFPPAIPMHDSWIGLLAERIGRVEVCREVSYQYRVHSNNLSHRRNPFWRKMQHRLVLLISLLARLAAYSVSPKPCR